MAAITIGLISAGMLASSLTTGSSLSVLFSEICDLTAIAGVVASVGLLEGL